MELRHLRYFVAVVERRGLREASRYLHVAQPAISQTLSNLESEIGVKLFMRLGRSVKLTPEGEIFYAETLRQCVVYPISASLNVAETGIASATK